MEDGLVLLYPEGTAVAEFVLILIVVEDGLVHVFINEISGEEETVLILIVVEDGLVRVAVGGKNSRTWVLILVVVEDGLVLILNH